MFNYRHHHQRYHSLLNHATTIH